jgi:hypothetical protein
MEKIRDAQGIPVLVDRADAFVLCGLPKPAFERLIKSGRLVNHTMAGRRPLYLSAQCIAIAEKLARSKETA